MARTPKTPGAPDPAPSGNRRRTSAKAPPDSGRARPETPLNEVDEASMEGMVASDPPSFTGTVSGGPDRSSAPPFDAPPEGVTSQDEETIVQIREHAYRLWEEAGRPEGREMDFWLLAERAFRERSR